MKVADFQLPLHNNFTSEFLNRQDDIRDLLGKCWQDRTVPDRSRRRLLHSMGYQFPCAKLLKLWGIRESDECKLCKRLHLDIAPWLESLGHIQARCPVLWKPRIAVHLGIWRQLLTAISRNSLETHDDGEKKGFFPSTVSEAIHNEWTVRQILVHLGLFSTIRRLEEEVATFHEQQHIYLTAGEITTSRWGCL